MNKINISSVYSLNKTSLESTIVHNLIRILSKKNIIYCEPKDADILFIGPYNLNTISNRFSLYLKKKLNIKVDKFSFLKKKNVKIFYSQENIRYHNIKADFYITSDMGIESENHLRIPAWKDYIDWSSEDFFQSINSLNAQRYGSYYNLNKLMNPQEKAFINKNKKFCIFTSHMIEPRKSIYTKFSHHFEVDGYGPYFDSKIKNHNSSYFKKKNILEQYSFNLCPQNSLYPGYYGENVPDAFLANTLPITWCDNNINKDFNERSFVNLLHYANDYNEIIDLIKSETFLKKFSIEPLIVTRPNLELEKNFVNKILEKLAEIKS